MPDLKTYRITSGSFAMPDGTRKGVGDRVQLASDVAATHAAALQEVPPEEAPAVTGGNPQPDQE